MYLIPCFLGALLFALYELNELRHRVKAMRLSFFAGCLSIAAGAAWSAFAGEAEALPAALRITAAVMAIITLFMTVYSLFFALPFGETYIEGSQKVCKRGVYALCRHPGVLFLALFCLFFTLAAARVSAAAAGAVITVMDVGYALYQDRLAFPKLFADYEEYKVRVPFLIPTASSLRECFNTLSLRQSATTKEEGDRP